MSGGTPVVIVQQSAQPLAALDLAGCPADAAANVAFGSAEGAAVSAQTISDAAATLAAITAAADAALTDIESDAGAIDDYLDG